MMAVQFGKVSLDLASPELILHYSNRLTIRLSDQGNFDEISRCENSIEFRNSNVSFKLDIQTNSALTEISVEITSNGDSVNEIENIFDFRGARLFGGSQMLYQPWPLNKPNFQIATAPFVTKDFFVSQHGPVSERYWLSSNKTAILADNCIPLWVGLNCDNDDCLRLKSRYKDCLYQNSQSQNLSLKYTVICPAEHSELALRDLHLEIMKTNFTLLESGAIPDQLMFEKPIWSTWVKFGAAVNQEKVISFAREISDHGFEGCQLEIDDAWETDYGDLRFDTDKFPDPKAMVTQLEALGFRVTIWVHPFVNENSATGSNASNHRYFVQEEDQQVSWIKWWNGPRAASVDFTNPDAASWFTTRLQQLQTDYGIASFKFDAGEVRHGFTHSGQTPNAYSAAYAKLAYEIGGATEVRIGCQTQEYPLFVRLSDKSSSSWGINNGLQSVITSTLTMGLLGYPFVLPDMVGGNAYKEKPSRELFIRWMQMNALLPAIQFSLTPWDFDPQVTEIARNLLELRRQFLPTILALAKDFSNSGAPIVRPMWWIDDSEAAVTCDSQYLLGNDILVAPIIQFGHRSRSIYLPPGLWKSAIDGKQYNGPSEIVQSVELDQLAFFRRVL